MNRNIYSELNHLAHLQQHQQWEHFISEVKYVQYLKESGQLITNQINFYNRVLRLTHMLYKHVTRYCLKNNCLQEDLQSDLQDAIETLFYLKTDYYESFTDTVV